MAKNANPDKPKKRRFEGFIHQKIEPNMQKALDFLSKSWGVPVQDVPGRAIQNAATDEALSREIKELKAQPTKKRKEQPDASASDDHQKNLRLENERLAAELQSASQRVAALEAQQAELRLNWRNDWTRTRKLTAGVPPQTARTGSGHFLTVHLPAHLRSRQPPFIRYHVQHAQPFSQRVVLCLHRAGFGLRRGSRIRRACRCAGLSTVGWT